MDRQAPAAEIFSGASSRIILFPHLRRYRKNAASGGAHFPLPLRFMEKKSRFPREGEAALPYAFAVI